MKRHEELKTLSWEHHDGLVAISRLRRGLENQTDPGELARFLIHVWREDLTHHFAQEEEALIPALEETGHCTELVDQVLDEHRRLKTLVESLPRMDTDKVAQLQKFADLLEEHIRFEEREFFVCAETSLDVKNLKKIGLYLREQHKPACKTWQPEFWDSKADSPAESNQT